MIFQTDDGFFILCVMIDRNFKIFKDGGFIHGKSK